MIKKILKGALVVIVFGSATQMAAKASDNLLIDILKLDNIKRVLIDTLSPLGDGTTQTNSSVFFNDSETANLGDRLREEAKTFRSCVLEGSQYLFENKIAKTDPKSEYYINLINNTHPYKSRYLKPYLKLVYGLDKTKGKYTGSEQDWIHSLYTKLQGLSASTNYTSSGYHIAQYAVVLKCFTNEPILTYDMLDFTQK